MPPRPRLAVDEGRRDVVNGKTVVFVPIGKSTAAWALKKPAPIDRARGSKTSGK